MSSNSNYKLKKDIDKQKVEKIENHIQINFSLVEFIRDCGVSIHSDGGAISCLFHEDESPSMFIDETRQIWKCHSCGRGGGYIRLAQFYNELVLGKKRNYYDTIEWILSNDSKLNSEFGLEVTRNVVEEQIRDFSLDRLRENLSSPKVNLREYKVTVTYKSLANKVKKMSMQKKMTFIIGLQNGKTVSEVQEDLLKDRSTYDKNKEMAENKVSLEDFL